MKKAFLFASSKVASVVIYIARAVILIANVVIELLTGN